MRGGGDYYEEKVNSTDWGGVYRILTFFDYDYDYDYEHEHDDESRGNRILG